MWLVMFQPYGGSFVPQMICQNEVCAQEFIKNMPWNSYGTYSYCFVPVLQPIMLRSC